MLVCAVRAKNNLEIAGDVRDDDGYDIPSDMGVREPGRASGSKPIYKPLRVGFCADEEIKITGPRQARFKPHAPVDASAGEEQLAFRVFRRA